jgi:hypothetical protein
VVSRERLTGCRQVPGSERLEGLQDVGVFLLEAASPGSQVEPIAFTGGCKDFELSQTIFSVDERGMSRPAAVASGDVTPSSHPDFREARQTASTIPHHSHSIVPGGLLVTS